MRQQILQRGEQGIDPLVGEPPIYNKPGRCDIPNFFFAQFQKVEKLW